MSDFQAFLVFMFLALIAFMIFCFSFKDGEKDE